MITVCEMLLIQSSFYIQKCCHIFFVHEKNRSTMHISKQLTDDYDNSGY